MLIDLDDTASWPPDVVGLLQSSTDCTALAAEIDEALQPHSVLAWHCTRLCPDEIEVVKDEGLVPLSAETLVRRVRRRVEAGDISEAVAALFSPEILPHFAPRCGRLCFSLTRASMAAWSSGGAMALWGGEAVFMGHGGGEQVEALLGVLGAPCVIELTVPVAALEFSIAWDDGEVYASRNARPVFVTGSTSRHLGLDAVRRIIMAGDPDFAALCPAYRGEIDRPIRETAARRVVRQGAAGTPGWFAGLGSVVGPARRVTAFLLSSASLTGIGILR